MPYLALIDQLNRFIRKKSSLLVLCGYSFHDNHLNDAIINALKSNPTGMVLGLMYGTYEDQSVERYEEAYKLAKKQHNLNVWTDDKAIIGTSLGRWNKIEDEDDIDLLTFIETSQENTEPSEKKHLVKLGDFSVFTNFLKKIIGPTSE